MNQLLNQGGGRIFVSVLIGLSNFLMEHGMTLALAGGNNCLGKMLFLASGSILRKTLLSQNISDCVKSDRIPGETCNFYLVLRQQRKGPLED